MPFVEKRSYPRKYTRGSVWAWMFELYRAPERCHVVEVSRKGVLVDCAQILRPGTEVQLAFAYSADSNVTRLVRRRARAERQTRNGLAFVFTDLPGDASDPGDSGEGFRRRPG